MSNISSRPSSNDSHNRFWIAPPDFDPLLYPTLAKNFFGLTDRLKGRVIKVVDATVFIDDFDTDTVKIDTDEVDDDTDDGGLDKVGLDAVNVQTSTEER